MSENIATSYVKNRGLHWKGIKISSLIATIAACVPALLFVRILSDNPILAFVIAASIVIGTFKFMEYFKSGKYDYERLENFIAGFKLPFSNKNLNKEEIANSVIQNDEWYLPSGDQLIGFQLLDSNEITFESFVNSVIPILPAYASIKFIKPQRPDKNAPEYLKNKNISIAEYFIFIRIPITIFGNSLSKLSLKRRIASLENTKVKLMKCSEISEVAEKIFFPFQETTGKDKPIFRSNIEISQGIARGLWPDKEIASISLAQLPEEFVNSDFSFLYNSISNLIGCVCVTIEIANKKIIRDAYASNFNKRHNGIDDKNDNNQSVSDSLSAIIQVGILLHANANEVADAIFSLDVACNAMGNKFKPIFGQDLGFLKKALVQYLPGSRPILPFRSHKVRSLKELMCYLPRPDFSSFNPNYDLIFRTTNNKVFTIEQTPEAPVLFIGSMGSGKSTLLFLNIKAHIEKKHKKEVAGCYIEIGGSFRYLAYQGLADVYFILRVLDNGQISPLADHPLKVFKSFGKAGEESAIKWLKGLCEFQDFEKEVQHKIESVIAKTISIFFEGDKLDLAEFYLNFLENVKIEYPQINENKEHYAWIFLKNLSRYVDPKRWGDIFCPDKVLNFDYDKARFYYFTTFESSLNPEGVYKPFFIFATMVAELVAEKYSSNMTNACKIQFLIDEVARLRNFIPEDLYMDLNSQSRKEGKIPFLSTQQAEDIALDEREWGSEKYKIVKSAKRMWFYQFPGPEILLSQFLEVPIDDLKIKKVRAIAQSNLLLKERGIYAWGYIDEFKNIHQLLIDIDEVTLWGCTTHAGGIAIREACMRERLYDYGTICTLLAERGPWPIPKEAGIPEEKIFEYVNKIIYRGLNHAK